MGIETNHFLYDRDFSKYVIYAVSSVPIAL